MEWENFGGCGIDLIFNKVCFIQDCSDRRNVFSLLQFVNRFKSWQLQMKQKRKVRNKFILFCHNLI